MAEKNEFFHQQPTPTWATPQLQNKFWPEPSQSLPILVPSQL